MKLLVVIVSFRVAQLTIDCLHSIAAEIANFPDVQVGVCENGTGDNSAAQIQRSIDENGWSSWCSLTVSPFNLGFTGGDSADYSPRSNAAQAPDYVLLLNPDTIVRPNAFRALVDFMACKSRRRHCREPLEEPDGTPQRSAFRSRIARHLGKQV